MASQQKAGNREAKTKSGNNPSDIYVCVPCIYISYSPFVIQLNPGECIVIIIIEGSRKVFRVLLNINTGCNVDYSCAFIVQQKLSSLKNEPSSWS